MLFIRQCGEELSQVVDARKVTRALVDDHLEVAVGMVGSRSFSLSLSFRSRETVLFLLRARCVFFHKHITLTSSVLSTPQPVPVARARTNHLSFVLRQENAKKPKTKPRLKQGIPSTAAAAASRPKSRAAVSAAPSSEPPPITLTPCPLPQVILITMPPPEGPLAHQRISSVPHRRCWAVGVRIGRAQKPGSAPGVCHVGEASGHGV